MVPESAFTADIPHRAFRVYAALCFHADRRTGECHPTNERLADLTGIHVRKVQEDLNSLEGVGLIIRREREGRRLIVVEGMTKTVTPHDQNGHGGDDRYGHGGVTKTVTPIEQTKEQTKEQTTPLPPSGGSRGGVGGETNPAPKARIRIPDSWAMANAEGPIRDLTDIYPADWVQAAVQQAIPAVARTGSVKTNPANLVGGILRRFAAQGGPDQAPTLKLSTAPALAPETEEERQSRLARWGAEEEAIRARNAARKGA